MFYGYITKDNYTWNKHCSTMVRWYACTSPPLHSLCLTSKPYTSLAPSRRSGHSLGAGWLQGTTRRCAIKVSSRNDRWMSLHVMVWRLRKCYATTPRSRWFCCHAPPTSEFVGERRSVGASPPNPQHQHFHSNQGWLITKRERTPPFTDLSFHFLSLCSLRGIPSLEAALRLSMQTNRQDIFLSFTFFPKVDD